MPTNTIGIVWVACSSGATPALESASVWRERNHFDRVFLHGGARAVAPAIVQTNILPNAPAQLLQRLDEGRHAILSFRIVGGERCEYADAPDSLALLRVRRERPRCAAEKRDELAPPHCPSQAGEAHRSGSNWEVGSGQTDASQCPLCAVSGLMHCSKQPSV